MNLAFNPIILVSSVVIGSISAYLAYRRGKNPYLWFAIGFFFGLFGLFAIFLGGAKKKVEPIRQEPVFTIQGPIDKFWYYLDPTHKQHGPMSHNALTEAWRGGEIDTSTYVWNEDMTDWKPIKEILKLEGGR